jgi:hypothetical protein
VWVTIRNANWRESDAGKALDLRISQIETRVQACEIRLEDLPTKADVARLFGRLETLTEMLNANTAGVNRIEDHFIRNYTGPK